MKIPGHFKSIAFALLVVLSTPALPQESVRDHIEAEIAAELIFYTAVVSRAEAYAIALDLDHRHLNRLSRRHEAFQELDIDGQAVSLKVRTVILPSGSWLPLIMAWGGEGGKRVGFGTAEVWMVSEEVHQKLLKEIRYPPGNGRALKKSQGSETP